MRLIMITTLAGPALTADAGTPVDVDDKFGEALKAGNYARDPKPGELRGSTSDAAFMAAFTGNRPGETEAERAAREVAERGSQLKQDGPTVADFVKAGYLAKNYPPAGYASKSTDAEIADAIKADEAAAVAKAKEPANVKAVALDKLDPKDDDDWTAAGKPAMGRIEALIGVPITRAEVEAMFPDFKRPEAGTGGGGGRSGPRTNNT